MDSLAAKLRGDGRGSGMGSLAAKLRGDGRGSGMGLLAAKLRGDSRGSGTLAAAKRGAFGSRLLAPLMRRDERGAIAAALPLVLTTVVDTSAGQDSGYRSSQDCAATGTSNSAQQQVAKAARVGSFIIAAPQPMRDQSILRCHLVRL
jgi:hypothetical protein